MPNPNRNNKPDIEKSEQELLNKSFDREFDVLAVENLAYDGQGLLREATSQVALRLDDTTTANVTYLGKAPIGTATSGNVWQIQKIDETSGTVITWADGNANFDNVWDNRASITYA